MPVPTLTKNIIPSGVTLRPIGDHLIVAPVVEPDTTASGLYIPETTLKPTMKAIVVGMGPGLPGKKGIIKPIPVNMYDVILIGSMVGTEVKVDGDTLLIIREDDIIAVVE